MKRNRDPPPFRGHLLCQFFPRPPFLLRAPKLPPGRKSPEQEFPLKPMQCSELIGPSGASPALEAQVDFFAVGDILCILLLYEHLQWWRHHSSSGLYWRLTIRRRIKIRQAAR